MVYSRVMCNTIKGDTMSERLTTEMVREHFLSAYTAHNNDPQNGAEFDEWLYFVRKEAHDEGYELCFADIGDDSR